MLQKIKNILLQPLTHFPLIWNTRLPSMLAALALVHLLFFAAGYITMSTPVLHKYRSLEGVGGSSLYWFSILISIGFLLGWLSFYLRNNAFKAFYQISKWHLLKEWMIIVVIVCSSISFFESFQAGAAVKVRKLIPESTLVKEANILNTGMRFIAQNRFHYFKLNDCSNDSSFLDYENIYDYVIENPDVDTLSSNFTYNSSARDSINCLLAFAALRQPGAFSYKFYCQAYYNARGYPGTLSPQDIASRTNEWINNNQYDSMQLAIQAVLDLCVKYSGPIRQNADSILSRNAHDSVLYSKHLTNSTRHNPSGKYYSYFELPYDVDTQSYLEDSSNLTQEYEYQQRIFNNNLSDVICALNLADERYREVNSEDGRSMRWIICLYIAISLSIILLTYRFFNGKVLLWTIVGSIVSTIFYSFVAMANSGLNSFGIAFLFVFFTLTLIGCLTLTQKTIVKNVVGILLNLSLWHLPFVCLIIIGLAQEKYSRIQYRSYEDTIPDQIMQQQHPILYWITEHSTLLSWLNLLLVFLLVGFLYTKLARSWRGKAEE